MSTSPASLIGIVTVKIFQRQQGLTLAGMPFCVRLFKYCNDYYIALITAGILFYSALKDFSLSLLGSDTGSLSYSLILS